MTLKPPVSPRVSGVFSLALDGPGLTHLNVTGADATRASKVVPEKLVVLPMEANIGSPLPCAMRVDPSLNGWNGLLQHGGQKSLKGNTKRYDIGPGVEETSDYQETFSASASDRTELMTTTIESSDGAGEQLEDVSDFSPATGRSHRCFDGHQSAEFGKCEQPVPSPGSPIESPNISHTSEPRRPSALSEEFFLSAASARYRQSAPMPSRSCVKSPMAEQEHDASSFVPTRKTAFSPFFLCRTCCTSESDLTQTLDFTSERAPRPAMFEETRGGSLPLKAGGDVSCPRTTIATGVSPQQLVNQLTEAEIYARAIVGQAQEKHKLCIKEAQRQAEAEVESFTEALRKSHNDAVLLQEEKRETDESHSAGGSDDAVFLVDADLNKAFKIIWSHVLSVDLSMPPRTVAMLRRTHHASIAVESNSEASAYPTTDKEPLDAAFSTADTNTDAEGLKSDRSLISAETSTSKPTPHPDRRLSFVDRVPQEPDSRNIMLEGLEPDDKVRSSYHPSEDQVFFTHKGKRRTLPKRSFLMFCRTAFFRKRKDML